MLLWNTYWVRRLSVTGWKRWTNTHTATCTWGQQTGPLSPAKTQKGRCSTKDYWWSRGSQAEGANRKWVFTIGIKQSHLYCATLFWGQMYSYFSCPQIYFLTDSHCKRLNVFSCFLKITQIFWTSKLPARYFGANPVTKDELTRNLQELNWIPLNSKQYGHYSGTRRTEMDGGSKVSMFGNFK